MARWRRPGADEMIVVFFVLASISIIWGWLLWHNNGQLWAFLGTAFLTWRVSRGGRISRMILIIGSCAGYAVAVLNVARMWDLAVVGIAVMSAVQIALLVSPSVYGRTRPRPVHVRAQGWSQLVRQPPKWLLPWGLFAGAVVTLVCLGHMDFVAVSGCKPAASGACTAVAEGYPLRWLTAHQNEPFILKGSMLKDWAQWTLVSMSVLYTGWPRMRPLGIDP